MTRRIDTSVPDPASEINRKANETLLTILERIEGSEWSFQRAVDALDVLWGVSAGLVDREIMDGITSAHGFCTAQMKKGHGDYDSVLGDEYR